MNALFGLWPGDGSAPERAALARMAAALDVGQQQPSAIWQDDAIGLGCVAGLVDTPGHGRPIHHPAAQLTLAVSARLVNRRELAEELGVDSPALTARSDGHLILAAWLRWQEACVHRLEGDWHFALWDGVARRLFLARDHHGSSSLYYRHSPGCFAFASTQKPLLALPPHPQQPNLLRIAQILGAVPGAGDETGYADIARLPPAHHLTLDPGGLRVVRYWFPAALPEIRLDDAACVEAFLHHYRRAVTQRLDPNGKTGVMLSGGLDSGSVAALAAPALAHRGERLYAFTSVPVAAPSPELVGRMPVDEGPLAAAVAEQVGNIALTPVHAASVSPLAGIERMLWVHDEPAYPPGNSFWLAALYRTAQAQGVRTLLTGTAGNDTVSWRGAPPDLRHLLLAGQPGPLVDEMRQLRARTGLSIGALLWTTLARPALRVARDRFLEVRGGRGSDRFALNPIHPRFAQQPEIAQILRVESAPPHPASASVAEWAAWRLNGPGRWLPPTFQYQDSHAFGLDVLDATADRRLMEFCLALENRHYYSGAEDRRLIRRAMRGLLPDSVRLVRRRARQSADLVSRLGRCQEEMAVRLDRLARHPLAGAVLDVEKLSATAQQVSANPASVSHATAGAFLLRGVMVGLFLERF